MSAKRDERPAIKLQANNVYASDARAAIALKEPLGIVLVKFSLKGSACQ